MAEYTARQYQRVHLETSPRDSVTRRYANATTYERYATAPYVHGPTYFENRLSDPGELSSVGDDWPASWEQVLHDTEEPPRALTAESEYSRDSWVVENVDRRGELVTRIVLRDQLPEEHATNAAAGWGTDRVLYFQSSSGNESGYLWIHRWDTSTDADEFEDAMTAFLEERRSETDDHEFGIRRLAPETTVVVTSDDGSVDVPSITAESNETVTVSLPD